MWLDDLLVVFQLKERSVQDSPTEEGEVRWFKRKVVNKGTQQIRDTLAYLSTHKQIKLENHRGHNFLLDSSAITKIHKVVCYRTPVDLSYENRMKKFHNSKTANIIHLISANDYFGITHTLLTPSELSEYLSFREELICTWGKMVESVPEPALVGQYLVGDADSAPSMEFIEYCAALQRQTDEWDMSGIIEKFPDRITTDNKPTDYYKVVTEIAKLKRNELREFKKRFELSMEKCRANEFVQPYRMAAPRTKCGFVFIPLEKAFVDHRRQGLKNLTYACKYDLKLPKCLGVSFAPDEDGWYSVEWCYMEFPWKFDAETDKDLKCNNPFRDVRTTELGRYTFRREE